MNTTHTIQNNTKSGSFSARATYKPLGNGMVEVAEWVHDRMGILPGGTEYKTLPLSEARAEYKQRKERGWR